MRAWCGFATLCAIGLLVGDAIVGAINGAFVLRGENE